MRKVSTSMEKKIRKLLIIFFAIMIAFTFLSRAAATAVVAKVQVDQIKEGNLTYKVLGTGIVKANARKYIPLVTGYKIGEVKAKKGKKVAKGDLLFCYDLKQLRKAESEEKDNLDKLKLQYENIGLVGDNNTVTDEATIRQTIQNAKEDIKSAGLNLEDQKEAIKKNKNEEYQKAVINYNEVNTSMLEAQRNAKKAILDAQEDLDKLKKSEIKADDLISKYKAAVIAEDSGTITDCYNKLFDFYYDGKYKDHKNQIRNAQKNLDRAKADLNDVEYKWKNKTINCSPYATDEEKNEYYEELQTKKNEIKAAERAVDDASEALSDLTDADDRLTYAISIYRQKIENNSNDLSQVYQTLYDYLLQGKEADQADITAAKTKLSMAREDSKEIDQEWESKLKAATTEKDKLAQVLKSIKEGSYDYTQDLKDQKKAAEDARRALKTAKLQLKQLEESKELTNENQKKQEKSYDIERRIAMIDIKEKEKNLCQLQELIAKNGKVNSPVAGVITENSLEQELTLTGQESLVITAGGCELSMSASKEDMKNFAVGDDITIKIGTVQNDITSQIENIELPDRDGRVKFTAILPKGDYKIGGSLEYTLTKDSDNYHMCIPIQAIRQDDQGTYVLLVKESDSVLGTIETAFRTNVTILSKDTKTAAIDGSLTEDDKIITGSNRNFNGGDRVRIYEME